MLDDTDRCACELDHDKASGNRISQSSMLGLHSQKDAAACLVIRVQGRRPTYAGRWTTLVIHAHRALEGPFGDSSSLTPLLA